MICTALVVTLVPRASRLDFAFDSLSFREKIKLSHDPIDRVGNWLVRQVDVLCKSTRLEREGISEVATGWWYWWKMAELFLGCATLSSNWARVQVERWWWVHPGLRRAV